MVAAELIKPGEIVTEYLGEWQLSTKSSSYRWGPIDAMNFRNYGPMVEDGFPNIASFYLLDTDGLPLRIVFAALEEIPPGKELTLNYGLTHSVKVQYHTEYRLAEMSKFFKEVSPNEMLNRIRLLHANKRNEISWEQNIELEGLITRIQYLFQTPSALALLIQGGVLAAVDAFTLFDKIDNRWYVLGYQPHASPRQNKVYKCFQSLKRYFSLFPKGSHALIDLFESVRIHVICEIFMEGMVSGKEESLCCKMAKDFNAFLDTVAFRCKESVIAWIAKHGSNVELIGHCRRHIEDLSFKSSQVQDLSFKNEVIQIFRDAK